jgi:cyclopropane-fatty-acyl-phospholipid synthase
MNPYWTRTPTQRSAQPAIDGQARRSANAQAARPKPPKPPAAERAVTRMLAQLSGDCLHLHTPSQSLHLGEVCATRAASTLTVHDSAVFGQVLRSGDIGFAESYLQGQWSTPDLPALLALLMRQRHAFEGAVYGSFWGSLAYRLRHALRRNSRAGSRHNIHAHYDLGNAFYALWLDESMSYSSAWWDGDPNLTLAQAQQRKMERALDEAGVRQGSKVLEIGCGWGALAGLAAQRGAQLTGVTLSTEQLSWAQEHLARAGQLAQTDLRLQDYRDLGSAGTQYDAIVSIEMIEAVGQAYWPSYFQTLKSCLAPGGRACIQSILIEHVRFERYAQSTDFIQQYIFPGGMLPSDAVFRAQAQAAGLQVVKAQAFGADYARTLALWRASFLAQTERVGALGFDTRFLRLWDFYLAYCQAAFETGQTDLVQYTLAHGGAGMDTGTGTGTGT